MGWENQGLVLSSESVIMRENTIKVYGFVPVCGFFKQQDGPNVLLVPSIHIVLGRF